MPRPVGRGIALWRAGAPLTLLGPEIKVGEKAPDFALAYGVLIREMGLLARTVFVIGPNGKIVYIERVADITHEPDYDSALRAARAAAK